MQKCTPPFRLCAKSCPRGLYKGAEQTSEPNGPTQIFWANGFRRGLVRTAYT